MVLRACRKGHQVANADMSLLLKRFKRGCAADVSRMQCEEACKFHQPAKFAPQAASYRARTVPAARTVVRRWIQGGEGFLPSRAVSGLGGVHFQRTTQRPTRPGHVVGILLSHPDPMARGVGPVVSLEPPAPGSPVTPLPPQAHLVRRHTAPPSTPSSREHAAPFLAGRITCGAAVSFSA